MVAALSLLAAGEWAATAQTTTPSRDEAMAACRATYGKKVTNVIIGKDGKVVDSVLAYKGSKDVRIEEALVKAGIKIEIPATATPAKGR